MKFYKAHWGISLIIVSAIITALLIGGAINTALERPRFTWAAILGLTILCGAALFTIRAYTITAEAILIHRLLWKTRVPLAGLQAAEYRLYAMRGGIRIFGNGGLFSISGWFWNKTLGAYRAFVTDLRDTVVLRFSARTVVVSPSSPEEFVRELAPASRPA
jgi:hypothetical protein